MDNLEITWAGGKASFSPEESPIKVGRSLSTNIRLSHPSVSRVHLEFIWNGNSWTVEDKSTHGTFNPLGVALDTSWELGSDATIRLGGVGGEEIKIRPISNPQPIQATEASNKTIVDERPLPRPIVVPETDEGEPSPSSDKDNDDAERLSPVSKILAEAPAPQEQIDQSTATRSDLKETADKPRPGLFDSNLAITNHQVRPNRGQATDPASTILKQGSLRLSVDGNDYFFETDTKVTLGRDLDCVVYVDETHTLVSRLHLEFYYQDDSWWMEDRSSRGTFVDNRRIKSPYKVQGAFMAHLGNIDAGTQLRVITAGEHHKPQNWQRPFLAGLIMLIMIVASWTLISNLLSSNNISTAKKSSVLLVGSSGLGSGFFVSNDLILTNQHVATLDQELFVAVTRSVDEPAEIEYVAETVELHPFLDIAVLKVTSKAEIVDGVGVISSEQIDDIGLPAATFGSGSDIQLGDQIISVGFPERFTYFSDLTSDGKGLPRAAVVAGEAANWTNWPGCSPGWELGIIPRDSPPGVTCSAEGELHRALLLASMESSRGASGSAVYHDGKVAAVIFAGEEDDPNKVLSIASDTFTTWLNEIIEHYS